MNGPGPRSEDTASLDCRGVEARMRELEGPSPTEAKSRGRQLGRVRQHLDACTSCRRRHAGRLGALEALDALQRRSLPEGVLDDLYAGVRERLPQAPVGGGMSRTFLDAPLALQRWRLVALTASLLLVVATGWVLSVPHAATAGGRGVVPLHDPRPHLLEAFDRGPDAATWNLPGFVPARRGSDDFFRLASPPPTPVDDEVRMPAGWR